MESIAEADRCCKAQVNILTGKKSATGKFLVLKDLFRQASSEALKLLPAHPLMVLLQVYEIIIKIAFTAAGMIAAK